VVRNAVCSIFAKDAQGNHRKIFSVEGDKESDPSIYFYEWSGSENKEKVSHYSYHSKQDENGLVQTHVSSIKDVSKQRQMPIETRIRVICTYQYQYDKATEDFPLGTLGPNDIFITAKPEYFGSCQYIFYAHEQGLKEYAQQKKCIVLHTYSVPVKNISQLWFGVLIQQDTLTAIQSGKGIPSS